MELDSLLENNLSGQNHTEINTAGKLDIEFGMYQALPSESAKTNPSEFLKSGSVTEKFPMLKSIVFDVFSVPVTEVTAERLFSFLNIAFNKLRATLDTGVLEDILFLRWNKTNFVKQYLKIFQKKITKLLMTH